MKKTISFALPPVEVEIELLDGQDEFRLVCAKLPNYQRCIEIIKDGLRDKLISDAVEKEFGFDGEWSNGGFDEDQNDREFVIVYFSRLDQSKRYWLTAIKGEFKFEEVK